MAESLIPPQPIVVQVLADKSEGQQWFYGGHWWTPGAIRDDGSIVGHHCFISAGIVWIDARLEPIALQHGWVANGQSARDGTLIQVQRT